MNTKGKTLQAIYYKSFATKFEQTDFASRKVSGYFSAFNIIDSDSDIIRKGAFAKSISERGPASTGNRKIAYLVQHDMKSIAGPLLKLGEDDYGLAFEGDIEQTPMGDIVLERYKNGTYREHSFGFQYVWEKCNFIDVPMDEDAQGGYSNEDGKTMQVFECKELNLFEGSVVTFGANSATPFTGFKGSNEDLVKYLHDELEFILRKSNMSYENEIGIRALWAKQISLAESLAGNAATKDAKRAEKPKGMRLETIKKFKL